MSLKGTLRSIEVAFGNPLARKLLSHMTSKCPHGYRSRLEHALKMLVEGVDKGVDQCSLDYIFLGLIVRLGAIITGGSIEAFKEYARDPPVRRGLALILRGIAEYGITVPQKLPAPFLIVWNFTNMCNLKCKHCYQRADKPMPDELSLEDKLDVLRQLDEAGVAAIAFSGGEPTIHPHFLRVASEASSRDIYVSIATNGTVITREYADKLKSAGVRYVEVSIDSADPKRHDSFRGIEGSWERAIRGVKASVEAGLTVGIATTLTKTNVEEIEDVVKLGEELGVKRIIFFNFIPVGRGEDIIHWDLTPEEREEALRTIYRLARKSSVEVATTAPQLARVAFIESKCESVSPTHFVVRDDPGLKSLADFIGGCGAGRIYAAVQPNGDVTPCVFYPVIVGNLKDHSFRDIWEHTELFKLLRNRSLLKDPCGSCQFVYVCGGCRARAYAYTGDPTGPDPGCIMARTQFYTLVKELSKDKDIVDITSGNV